MSALEIIKIFFAEYDGGWEIENWLIYRNSEPMCLALDVSEGLILVNLITSGDSVFEENSWILVSDYIHMRYSSISVDRETAAQPVPLTPELIEELTAIREMASL